MSNVFLPDTYVERFDRLAFGIEPFDAVRALAPARPVNVTFDGMPDGSSTSSHQLAAVDEATRGLVPLARRSGSRFVVLHRPGLAAEMRVRISDPQRRFVPRRIAYAIPADIDVAAPRVRRPALFPGAAYEISYTATGLRGRATRGNAAGAPPARWLRVVARVGGTVVGRAQGDDRGEFLLILDPEATGPGELQNPFTVSVSILGPATAPVPTEPDLPARDPLWDLPLEVVSLVPPDDVSPGVENPAGYSTLVERDVTILPGRLRSDEGAFVLPA